MMQENRLKGTSEMKKRLFCLFLAVILVLGLIPAPAVSARGWDSSHRSGPAGFQQISDPVSPLKPLVSADTPEDYLALCTLYPSYLTIRTDGEFRLWTMPCDDLVCANSQALELTNDGDLFTVTGLYRNTEGKYWYRVSRAGTVCYLYSPHGSVVEFLSFDMTAQDLVIPGGIAVGTSPVFGGSITSVHNRIGTVEARVLQGDSLLARAELAVNGNRADLKKLRPNLGALEAGSYELILSVTARSHYSTDGLTLMEEALVPEPLRTTLEIVGAEGHICDRGSYLGSSDEHPHYDLYQCSLCGGTVTDYAAPGSRLTCEYCLPGKPELKVLAYMDGAVTCTWTDTPNTDYTELLLMVRDETGSWVELENISPAASGVFRVLEPGDYRVRLCATAVGQELLQTWADDVYFTVECTAEDLVYDGVDVSYWQEAIDWATFKEDTDYAILRCGFGSNQEKHDDKNWYANADGCEENGIPYGVYLYSYALTDADAVSEAEHALRLLEGYDPDLPVYLDIEDESIDPYREKKITLKQQLRNATIFCNMLEEAGYTVGIYASKAWWYYYMTQPTWDRWSRWVAQYTSQCTLEREYDQWQYTDKGKVPGIKTNVDLNYWYGALPGNNHVHCYQASELIRATCLSEGLEERICPCGESYEQVIPISGCAYGEWTVLVAPTLQTEGLREHTCLDCGETVQQVMERLPLPFADVTSRDYYYEPVLWALLGGITSGVSPTAFAPFDACLRSQVVTFLWRSVGSPVTEGENPFEDVKPTDYYYDAVLWAVENGITSGLDATHFGPNEICSRSQVVTFLHRADGSPTVEAGNPFEDVTPAEYYYESVLWAVEKGITNGTKPGIFAPNDPCNRSQVVTFLYRAAN